MSHHQTLKQAPLIHVVAQLNFSALPQLEHADIVALHGKLAAIGFPDMVEASMDEVELSFDANIEPSPQRISRKIQRFVFKAEGNRSLVEFRKDQLVLKTTNYSGHNNFLKQWFEVVAICSECLSSFKQALLQDMTLRYIDLIVPKEGEELQTLIKESLLPPGLSVLDADSLFGSTTKIMRTAANRQLRIGFSEITAYEQRLTKVLPDDLTEHVLSCGLSIKALSHWEKLVAPSYGLLDVEHKYVASNKPALAHVNIEGEFQQLYQPISNVFWDLITDEAKSSWS